MIACVRELAEVVSTSPSVHPCLRRCQCVVWRRQDVVWALSRTQHARTSLCDGDYAAFGHGPLS